MSLEVQRKDFPEEELLRIRGGSLRGFLEKIAHQLGRAGEAYIPSPGIWPRDAGCAP